MKKRVFPLHFPVMVFKIIKVFIGWLKFQEVSGQQKSQWAQIEQTNDWRSLIFLKKHQKIEQFLFWLFYKIKKSPAILLQWLRFQSVMEALG